MEGIDFSVKFELLDCYLIGASAYTVVKTHIPVLIYGFSRMLRKENRMIKCDWFFILEKKKRHEKCGSIDAGNFIEVNLDAGLWTSFFSLGEHLPKKNSKM